MKKKISLVFIAFITVLFCLTLFTGCEQVRTFLYGNEGTEDDGKTDEKEEEHVHSDACWQRGATVHGNCQTYGYTEFQCAVTGEVKREYETKYGDHEYSSHVCRLCGKREDGEEMWSVGTSAVYLYTLYTDLSGDDSTYWLVVDGENARMRSYDSADDLPWNEYLSHIARVEVCAGVTQISDYFMYGATMLTDLSIGAGVASIGAHAFENCVALSSVTTGNNVLSVGEYAFAGCSALTTCRLSPVCADVGVCAFENCPSLRSLTIAKTGSSGSGTANRFFGSIFSEDVGNAGNATQLVTYEGTTYGFELPERIQEVTLSGNFDVEPYAFRGTDLVRSITFTGNVTSIGEYAFADMPELADLVFETATLTTINKYAFEQDGALGSKRYDLDENGDSVATERVITLPSSLTYLGEGAFKSCSGLEHVELGETHLTEIPIDAFNACTALAKITFPETLTTIFLRAFAPSGLSEIRIPASVRTIQEDAFKGCSGLETVYVDSEDVYHTSNDERSGLFCGAKMIYVLASAVTDDPREEDESYIKKNYTYKGLDDNGYHLWMK